MNRYAELYLTFARIGAVMFGGGYALLPILQRELAEKRGWVTEEELVDCYAVAQCTPGAIAVNVATYAGAKRGGALGGAAATLGVISPAIVIITVIALGLRRFAEYEAVRHALAGINVAVTALIAGAVVKLWKTNVRGLAPALIFAAALLLTLFTRWSPVWLTLAAALVGMAGEKWRKKR